MLNNDNKFDIDLKFGQIYERELISALTGSIKIEVKTERDSWVNTGNIAIEYMSRGKKSGISVTESSLWYHILTLGGQVQMMFVFPIHKLKSYIRNNWNNIRKVKGGDNNTSELLLIPIKDLYKIGA